MSQTGPTDVLENFNQALRDKNLEVSKALLDTKEMRAVLNTRPLEVLESVAFTGNIEVVKLVLNVKVVEAAFKKDPIFIFKKIVGTGDMAFVKSLLHMQEIEATLKAKPLEVLGVAAESGSTELVKFLLTVKEVEAAFRAQPTDVFVGLMKENPKSALEFIKSQIDLKEIEAALKFESFRMLSIATESGDVEFVNKLLEIREFEGALKAQPLPILLRAAAQGNVALVSRLLKVEEVETALKAQPMDVLTLAAFSGKVELVESLLNVKGVEALLMLEPIVVLKAAAESGNIELVQWLLKIKRLEAAFMAAPCDVLKFVATSGNIELFQSLLEVKGVDAALKAQPIEVLKHAARKGRLEFFKLLLKVKEIDVALKAQPISVLALAARSGSVELVEFLLDLKEVALALKAEPMRVLDQAAFSGSVTLFESPRIEKEVDAALKARPIKMLSMAALGGSLELVKFLLFKTKEREAALMAEPTGVLKAAAFSGNEELMEWMLRMQEIKVGLRRAPYPVLFQAVRSAKVPLVKLLLKVPEVRAVADKVLRKTTISLQNVRVLSCFLEMESVQGSFYTEASVDDRAWLRRAKEIWAGFPVEKLLKKIEENIEFIDELMVKFRNAFLTGKVKEVEASLTLLKESGLEGSLARNANELFLFAIENTPEHAREQVVKRLLESRVIRQAEGVESSGGYRQGQQLARAKGDEALALLIRDSVRELEMTSGGEAAMQALSLKQEKLFRVLKLRYADKFNDVIRQTAAMNEIEAAIRHGYEKSPAQFKAPGKATTTLPLVWPERLLSDAELALYRRHEWHTAFRYFLNPNPWMSQEAEYVSGDPMHGTGFASVTDADRVLFAMLWEAVNDKDLEVPGMGAASPTQIEQARQDYRETFLKVFSELNRAHNWDKYKTRDDGEGDKPTCDLGVTQRMVGFLQTRMELPILTKQDIEGRFRANFIDEVIDKMDLGMVMRLQRWVDSFAEEGVAPCETDIERESRLAPFTFSKKEVEAFKSRCQEIYKESSGKENALKEAQTVHVRGIVHKDFENFDEYVDFMCEKPEQTFEYFMGAINDRLELRKSALAKEAGPAKKSMMSK